MEESEIDFVKWVMWEDWLSECAGIYQEWTIIGQDDGWEQIGKNPCTQILVTLSYVTSKNHSSRIQELLSNDQWDTQFEDSSITVTDFDNKISARFLGLGDIRPLVTKKAKIYDYQPLWRLDTSFEDYFDLREGKTGSLVDPRSGDTVVRIAFPANQGTISIRTDYLQEYLAAFDMICVRQHDHRRHWTQPRKDFEQYGDTNVIKKKWGCYRVDFRNQLSAGVPPFSRLLCKDIVTPASKPGLVGRHRVGSRDADNFPEFIVGRTLEGNILREKPNRGRLYPIVFFNPRVLKRYYDEPTRYSVSFSAPGYGSVSDEQLWSMPVGRNSEGLITCWLGDIAKSFMPIADVNHWLAHNVPPMGGESKEFIDSQLHCRVSSAASLEARIVNCRDQLISAFKKNELEIFRVFEKQHEHLYRQLRTPLFDEYSEFSTCILNLHIALVEYLNVEFFISKLTKEERTAENGDRLSSINLLSRLMLKCTKVEQPSVSAIVNRLKLLHAVRSKCGVAHSLSESSFQKVIAELNFKSTPPADRFYLAIAEPLVIAMENVCVEMGECNYLWWRNDSNIT